MDRISLLKKYNKYIIRFNSINKVNETYGQFYYYTVRHKKLHHFVFAITLSYLYLFEY